ncbi:hypothetical protein [Streptomyces sp. RLB3-17]|uniref:hypothetical protein n=1 Tax=Streptomyces sp. RLB3-17 TaxID=2594455 RepID=UPI001CEC20F7|nr:hypothetical protein [Streptomyces sp. RLB3-17]
MTSVSRGIDTATACWWSPVRVERVDGAGQRQPEAAHPGREQHEQWCASGHEHPDPPALPCSPSSTHASWARRVLLRPRYGEHHVRGQRQGGGRRFGAGGLIGAGAAGLVGGALLNEAFDDEPEVVVNNDYEDEPQTPDGARSSPLRTAGCPGAAGCRRVGAYTGCSDVRWV